LSAFSGAVGRHVGWGRAPTPILVDSITPRHGMIDTFLQRGRARARRRGGMEAPAPCPLASQHAHSRPNQRLPFPTSGKPYRTSNERHVARLIAEPVEQPAWSRAQTPAACQSRSRPSRSPRCRSRAPSAAAATGTPCAA
jgi:hypothetical protein